MAFSILAVDNSLAEFYEKSSVYVPNKYIVYLDGPYLTEAITNMERKVNSATEYPVDKVNFDQWKAHHVSNASTSATGDNREFSSNGYKLNFLWACKDITIPLVDIDHDPDDSFGLSLDPVRNLKYTIVTNYTSDDSITMTLLEQKGMIWYHFLNELGNLFYDAKLMTARDSVHKLRMQINTLITQDWQDTDIVSYKKTDDGVSAVRKDIPYGYDLGQQFEFNSIVFSGADNVSLGHADANPMEHSITFKIPNPFQKSFKHDLSGLRNRVHDDDFVSGRSYNKWMFESDIPGDVQAYEDFITDDSKADSLDDTKADLQ